MMKNLLLCVAVLLCAACEKDSLPEWRNDMSFNEIERYAAVQGRIDDAKLLDALSSSVFAGCVFNNHIDGVWEHEDELRTGGSYDRRFLFEDDSRCMEGVDLGYPPFQTTRVYDWTYDAARKSIILRDDSGRVYSEMNVVWFSAGRMILRVMYPEPLTGWHGGENRAYSIDMQYFVGDFASMTRDEFRERYLAPEN